MTVTFEYDETLHPRGAGGRWGSGDTAPAPLTPPVDLERLQHDLMAAAPDPSGEQYDAIADYTDSSYMPINRALRDGTPVNSGDAQTVTHLTGYLEDAELPAITVYRGLSLEPADLATLTVGSTVVNPGFTSTTIDPGSYNGSTQFVVQVPDGTHGAYVGAYSTHGHNEREVLFPPGLAMRIDHIEHRPVDIYNPRLEDTRVHATIVEADQ